MVADAFAGMAVQVAGRAKTDVEAICDRESFVLVEYSAREMGVNMKLRQYFEILKFSLDPTRELVVDAENMDWERLYRFALKQSILGIVFEGVQRMMETGVKPPRPLLLKWIATVNKIKEKNLIVNNAAVKLTEKLRQDGFESCILKGQGNNLLYPNVFNRVPGDIDVWVRPLNGEGQKVERYQDSVIQYAKRYNPKVNDLSYHHVDLGEFESIAVELHYRPSFMFQPIHNRRLQQWCVAHADQQFSHVVDLPDGVGKVAVPYPEFNVIFQLSHIYNHLLHEGIGLRQVIDYYYLLKSGYPQSEDERLELKDTLHRLGMEKIAGAMMWVLSEVLGLEDQYLIAPKDERRGRVLMFEIMRGGNFGHYDKRNIKADSPLKKNLQRLQRDFRMMRYFPSECLWEPVFRLYHFFWRMRHG